MQGNVFRGGVTVPGQGLSRSGCAAQSRQGPGRAAGRAAPFPRRRPRWAAARARPWRTAARWRPAARAGSAGTSCGKPPRAFAPPRGHLQLPASLPPGARGCGCGAALLLHGQPLLLPRAQRGAERGAFNLPLETVRPVGKAKRAGQVRAETPSLESLPSVLVVAVWSFLSQRIYFTDNLLKDKTWH